MLNIIAAVSKNNVIGRQGKLPWHLPGDLKRFRDLTINHTVVMGPKTYQSIGRPLPKRMNIVLTKSEANIPGAIVYHTIEPIIELAMTEEVFIIGGAKVFETFLPEADNLYLTRVHVEIPDGDVFFPVWNQRDWDWAYEPLNMIAEVEPGDEYQWSIEDYRRLG